VPGKSAVGTAPFEITMWYFLRDRLPGSKQLRPQSSQRCCLAFQAIDFQAYRGRKRDNHDVSAKTAELVLEVLFRLRGNIAVATLPLEFGDELACCCHLTIVPQFALRSDGATNSFRDCRMNGHAISTSVSMRVQTETNEVEHQIITLTADIVSAHVANNDVAVNQLAGLIREVHRMLATVEQVPVDPIKAEPAVAVKKSVFADHILCLDCGQGFKMLKRHLSTDHQMTPEQYRAKWDLPPTYPMVAAEYAATRSKLAKDAGLGRRAKIPPPSKKKAGRAKKG
jgi:predicted transcriptional regulator